MYTTISPDALGIRGLALSEAIDLARDAGFAGLSFDSRAAARAIDEQGLPAVQEAFARAGVKPALWNLPVAWRDENQWETDLRELPRLARVARDLGSTRTATFMPDIGKYCSEGITLLWTELKRSPGISGAEWASV